MRIQDTTINNIKSCDISIVASQYTVLKDSKKTLVGCCPIHREKTPSFHVYKSSNTFKCFGCGKSGDAIELIKEVEKIDFFDAVKKAAEILNVEFSTFESDEDKKIKRYAKILEAFYRSGAILDKPILIELGAINDKGKSFFDNRKLFPIRDEYGYIRGVSGRTLNDNIKPKYKNSIESWFYKKSELLYNLHEAKKTRRETKTCVLVEGFTDVDTLKSAGVLNCVASCGTSLTESQAKLLSKYFTKVVVMYDNDGNKAGQKAAFRALDILLKYDLDVDVVWLPSGQDPKSYIESGFLLKDLKPCNFILEKSRMIKKCSLEVQLKKITSLFDTLKCINSNIKKEMYVNEVAKILELKHFKSDFENYINGLNPKQNKVHETIKNVDSDIDILNHVSGQKHLDRLRKINTKAIENTIAIINNTNSTSELLNIFKRDLMRVERYKFLNNENS